MAFARTTGLVPAHRSLRRLPGVVLVLVLVLAAMLVAVLAPSAVHADPLPSAAEMTAKAHDLEKVTEQYNAAHEQLDKQQAAAQAALATLSQARAELTRAQSQVKGIARSAFTGSDLNGAQAMLTSGSAGEFVAKLSTLQAVAGYQGEVLGRAADAAHKADAAQAVAQKAAADAKAKFDALNAQRQQLQGEINQYQAQLAQLSAADRQTVVGGGSGAASRDARPAVAAGSVKAPTQAAQVAVDTALAQQGKPYVWAATGPGSFDCSGLVQFSYKAAGVSLPRTADAQVASGRPVTRAQLRPGDLIGYYSPVTHIAMYIGNGQVVQAPSSGDVVKVSPIDGPGTPTAMSTLS
jgi:cell wall-associated NlpC family hydrolase